jgi:hypothetical protein
VNLKKSLFYTSNLNDFPAGQVMDPHLHCSRNDPAVDVFTTALKSKGRAKQKFQLNLSEAEEPRMDQPDLSSSRLDLVPERELVPERPAPDSKHSFKAPSESELRHRLQNVLHRHAVRSETKSNAEGDEDVANHSVTDPFATRNILTGLFFFLVLFFLVLRLLPTLAGYGNA